MSHYKEYYNLQQLKKTIISLQINLSQYMTNRIKQSLFTTQSQLQEHSLYLEEQQISQFFNGLTLQQKQEILTIHEQKIIQYIFQYISYYISNKKNITNKNTYSISKDQQILLYAYDCKIFRNNNYNPEDNQIFNIFLIAYKQNEKNIIQQNEDIYQFVNTKILNQYRCIIKCKLSYLMKIYSMFKEINIQVINGDNIILTQEYYYKFIFSWMHFSNSVEIEPMIRHLFRGIMILMHNNILLKYSKMLTIRQKQYRKYQKPVIIYEKPKLKQTYTMVQEGLGDVEWNTLKIFAFKFKYKVVQNEKSYICYRVKQQQKFNQSMHKKIGQMQQEDAKIMLAFDKIRENQVLNGLY